MARALRLYEREVSFYREIGSAVGVRVPLCYHSALSENGEFALVMEDVNGQPGDQLADRRGCHAAGARGGREAAEFDDAHEDLHLARAIDLDSRH